MVKLLRFYTENGRKESKMMIEKDLKIGELLEKYPEKANVLLEAGMHCIGCPASLGETLEEACLVHGIDVDDLIKELNKEVEIKSED